MSAAPKTNHALSTDGLQNVHFYDLHNLDYLAFLPLMPFWNNKKKQQSNYKYILTIGVDSRTLELIFRRLGNLSISVSNIGTLKRFYFSHSIL
jgi:hypothetical protein